MEAIRAFVRCVRYRPTRPNQQWHTDVMYVWVACRYYFLVTFIDAFSRYVVHHRLLVDLNGQAIATELEAALSTAGKVRPHIVHDQTQPHSTPLLGTLS